jgi:hypothetical protein
LKEFFINNNDAPFGSPERKTNVEIRKEDENKLLFTFPCYPLKGWKVYSKWEYRSNEDGDILKKKLHFRIITNENIVYISGIRMLKYSLGKTYDSWKMARSCSKNRYYIKSLQERATVKGKDEWWRKVNAFVAKMALKNLGVKEETTRESYTW